MIWECCCETLCVGRAEQEVCVGRSAFAALHFWLAANNRCIHKRRNAALTKCSRQCAVYRLSMGAGYTKILWHNAHRLVAMYVDALQLLPSDSSNSKAANCARVSNTCKVSLLLTGTCVCADGRPHAMCNMQ